MEKIDLYPEKEFACLGCPNAIWQEGKIGTSMEGGIDFVNCHCQKMHNTTFRRTAEEAITGQIKPMFFFTNCQAKEDFLREIIDRE